MTPLAIATATLAIFAGALVQGSIGFGLNLLSAPVLVLIDPHFVPVPVILVSLVINLLFALRNRGERPWHAMRWPMVGAVPAILAGVAAVGAFDPRTLGIVFGVLLLVGVGLSVSGLHPAHTARNLALAGSASGFMGTTTGVGGPPMGLMFQHAGGAQLRASLLRFFLFTSTVSILLFALFGEIHRRDLGLAALLGPGALLGFLLAPRLTQVLDRGYVRQAVLAVSALSATVVLVRALV